MAVAKKVNFQGFNFAKYLTIGAIGGLFAFIVSSVFRFFNLPIFNYQNEWVDFSASVVQIDLRSQILKTGYFKDIGLKFLEFLQGTFNFSPIDFFGVILGAICVLLIGRIASGFFPNNKMMRNLRVFLSFLFGGAIVGLLVPVWLGLPFTITFFSMVIYGFALGLIMQVLVRWKKLRWLTE